MSSRWSISRPGRGRSRPRRCAGGSPCSISSEATTRACWAWTSSAAGWSKMVRTSVATHGCADLGTRVSRLRRSASHPGAVLGRGDVDPQDLAVPAGVDTGGHQHVHVDDPAALTHRVRAALQRAVAERGDLGAQDLGHLADLTFGDALDAHLLDQLVPPPRADAQEIEGGDHADQGLLGPATSPSSHSGSRTRCAVSGPPARRCRRGCPSHGTGSRCGG